MELRALRNYLHGHEDACSSPPGSSPCSFSSKKKEVGLTLYSI